MFETDDGTLVGRGVRANVGDSDRPLGALLVEIELVDELVRIPVKSITDSDGKPNISPSEPTRGWDYQLW